MSIRLALGWLWILGTGACSLSVEVDVRDVEVTQRGVHFDALPASLPGIVLSTTQSFEITPATAAWAKDLNANVRAMKVRLHAAQGVSNLDFIRFALVTMSSAAGSPAGVEIMHFERSAETPSGPDLECALSQPIDVTQAWSGERVRIDVTVAGVLPAQAWAVDVSLHLCGGISYRS